MDWVKVLKSNEYLLKDASLRLVLLETKRKCLPIKSGYVETQLEFS